MKKIIFAIFLLLSVAVSAKNNSDENCSPNEREKRMHEHLENLSPEQKEKLLAIRREYFSELKIVQEKFRELRKEANHCMMNNDEVKYEEIHDKMNELKMQREQIKQSYKTKINKVIYKK